MSAQAASPRRPAARADLPLLERADELTEIAERVAATADGAGGLLMVEGAAGIGKSRLLGAARERADSRGLTVLTARGSELERGFPFGVVRALFEKCVLRAPAGEREQLLSGVAGAAEAVLGSAPGDGEPARDGIAFAGLHGLYWLTANLAERAPLLLAIDDAHWADEASLRFLIYLARRIEALPVLLVVARRPAEPGTDRGLLDALRADPLARVLHPAPLSEQAATQIVQAAFSPRAGARLCRACHGATGGNPLLLRMLASALREEGVDPEADGAARVAQLAPRVVAGSVLPRLRRLPADTGALARGIALLGDGAELRHAAALVGLGAGAATRAADALVAAGILAAGRPLEFVHPTVRRAIYESLPAAEHHRGHRQAAVLLAAEGAPADRVAAHLVRTERLGDAWAVDVLRAAARAALARGAAEEAVGYLRRAQEEPPAPQVRVDVLVELGSAAALIRIDEARDHLERALEIAVGAGRRAAIALELARVMSSVARETRGALAVLDRAVAELGPADPAMRVRLEAEYISVARRYPATRAGASRRLRELAGRAEPGSVAGCVLLANLADDALDGQGRAAEATRLACAALAGDRLLESGESDAALMASGVLMATDRTDAAWRAWNGEADRARLTGSVLAFATAITIRAGLAYRCGQLAEAEADARLADEVYREHWRGPRRFSLAFLVDALVERGETAQAADLLDTADVPMNHTLLLDSRGRLRYAQGRFAEAVDDFLACGQRLTARGIRHPGILAWRSSAALALQSLDQRQEAFRLVDEELDLARRLDVPRALGIALRAAGLLRGGRDGIALLEEATGLLARSAARLEEARALADLGAALRRAGHRTEAREPLRRALDLAVRCDAAPLATRAREELVAAGARPRRAADGVGALTPSELRVARMAAEGMGNRAIAQALFVTVKTVEMHLGSTYRKLGLTSRTGLAAALPAGAASGYQC